MSVQFGWCQTNQHDICKAAFTYHEKTYNCICECHSDGNETPMIKSSKPAVKRKVG